MSIIGWTIKAPRRVAMTLVLSAIVALGSSALPGTSQAQPAGLDPSRDCQTIRTCNFTRSGAVRGCLSSYTCRVCKTVRSRCNLGGHRFCQRFVCNWGG